MALWTCVEGLLSDGRPMRVFLAEHDSMLWAANVHDDDHPKSEDEFIWRLGPELHPKRDGNSRVLREAARQVKQYFSGKRREFELPIAWRGSDFQNRVWQQLTRIPYGHVQSYGEVAEAIGSPLAPRAVGGANRCNHLALFIPCHRVIASGGKIGGYTGGLGLKRRLLAHEGAVLTRS